MTRKKRRAAFILAGFVTTALSVGLLLWALQTRVTFFFSPADIAKATPATGTRFRLGGLVAAGSVKREKDATALFTLTDGAASQAVLFKGVLPDLFRENQGIIAEGRLQPDGVFLADTVLAKHDENYMPPDVAQALKKNGRWKDKDKSATAPGS